MAVDSAGSKARVALVACPGYGREEVRSAVGRCLELLGGLEAVLPRGGRVLVKPNLLLGIAPDRAVTTHPAVVEALLHHLGRREASCLVGDSPMFARPEVAARRAGLLAVCEEHGAAVADMGRTTVVQAPEGRRFRRFEVAAAIDEVDLVVNVFKLKTHGLTGLTLAIKNLFGLVPGLDKSKWHLRAPVHRELSDAIVDLFEALTARLGPGRPMLHVADAVVGLEGEGPGSAGRPRQVGALAASYDAVALEAVLARLVGFEPAEVTTAAEAARRGLGSLDPEEVELVGDPLESLAVSGFVRCRRTVASGSSGLTGRLLESRFLRDRMVERPLVREDLCTGCGDCRTVCAAGAIELGGSPPKAAVDHGRCIRCYCCIEACRYAAARLGPRPLLARAADRMHLLPWLGAGLVAVALVGAAWWLLAGPTEP